MTTLKQKIALVEATLFITSRPLTLEEISKITGYKPEVVGDIIESLKEKYSSEEHGIMISELGGYKMAVKPEFVTKVRKLTPHSDLSRGLLKVLSIVAYYQPIKQSDIVKVIGNRTYSYVKELERRGLISVKKSSRTKILVTTKLFEEYFGVEAKKVKEIAKNMVNENDKESDE